MHKDRIGVNYSTRHLTDIFFTKTIPVTIQFSKALDNKKIFIQLQERLTSEVLNLASNSVTSQLPLKEGSIADRTTSAQEFRMDAYFPVSKFKVYSSILEKRM